MINNLLKENIKEAFKSIRSHILRAALTIVIVAIGIMSLVGILTALDSIKGSISENFMRMGSNTFSINNQKSVTISSSGHRSTNYDEISYFQAQEFKKRFDFPGIVSLNAHASWGATLKYESNKTNPNISVLGIDENYMLTAGYELQEGRNFSPHEMQSEAVLLLLVAKLPLRFLKIALQLGVLFQLVQPSIKL